MKKYQVLFKYNRRTVCIVCVLANNENEASAKAENLIMLDLRNIEYNKIVIISEK
jgi:hypothetical protein